MINLHLIRILADTFNTQLSRPFCPFIHGAFGQIFTIVPQELFPAVPQDIRDRITDISKNSLCIMAIKKIVVT